jgi:hypothetical protein
MGGGAGGPLYRNINHGWNLVNAHSDTPCPVLGALSIFSHLIFTTPYIVKFYCFCFTCDETGSLRG